MQFTALTALLLISNPTTAFSIFGHREHFCAIPAVRDRQKPLGHLDLMMTTLDNGRCPETGNNLKLPGLNLRRRVLLSLLPPVLLWQQNALAVPKGGTLRLSGTYSDPMHPDCTRIIKPEGIGIVITGTDEVGGPQWKVYGKVKGDDVVIDFSPKGGPSEVLARFTGVSEEYDNPTEATFKFPDGNVWTRVNQREKTNALRFAGSYVQGKRAGVDALKRKVAMSGFNAIVTGQDEVGGPEWKCKGKVDGDKLVIDFSSKGGSQAVVAQKTAKGLEFQDGTVWKCVGVGGSC